MGATDRSGERHLESSSQGAPGEVTTGHAWGSPIHMPRGPLGRARVNSRLPGVAEDCPWRGRLWGAVP